MNEKELKKEILMHLKTGKTKNEIYEKYCLKSDDQMLRKILASRPSPNIKNGNKIIHKIICSIWILIFIMELLGLIDLVNGLDIRVIFSLAVTTYILIQLLRFNGNAFLPSMVWLIYGIINSVKEINTLSMHDIDYDAIVIATCIYILVALITIGLTSIVRKNVFGHYQWFKPKLDNTNKIIFQNE